MCATSREGADSDDIPHKYPATMCPISVRRSRRIISDFGRDFRGWTQVGSCDDSICPGGDEDSTKRLQRWGIAGLLSDSAETRKIDPGTVPIDLCKVSSEATVSCRDCTTGLDGGTRWVDQFIDRGNISSARPVYQSATALQRSGCLAPGPGGRFALPDAWLQIPPDSTARNRSR